MAVQISKKRKFVSDGIFKAELNEFLTRELAEDGYSGVEVRVTPTRTEIIILATRTQNVLGEKGRRIRELTAVVQKRFGFPEGSVEVKEVGRMSESSGILCRWCSAHNRHRSPQSDRLFWWFHEGTFQMCHLLKHIRMILTPYCAFYQQPSPPPSCTLRKLPLVVCVPLPRRSLCATSCWEAWRCAGRAMAF
uniref:Ribosomal protein S3 n=1 Tax=Tetraodon nigroviridis TaxID=99883 RepID=H3CKJ3_TETNG